MIPRDRLTTGLLVGCIVMFGIVASLAARQLSVRPAFEKAVSASESVPASNRTAAQVIERSFRVQPGQTLFLDSDRGAVTVRGTEGDHVHVRVFRDAENTDHLRHFDVSFQQSSGGIDIQGRYDGPRIQRRRGVQVRYEIAVPHTFNAEVRTAGGSLHIADIQGTATLHTSGGSIEATHIDGPLMCKTSGGSIRATDVRGDVVARTSGGSITLRDIYGTADVHTSGGSISTTIVGQPADAMELKTSGGSITLALDETVRADIDAHASGGRVTTALPMEQIETIQRDHLRAVLNGGGPQLTLHTSGGSIRIQPN